MGPSRQKTLGLFDIFGLLVPREPLQFLYGPLQLLAFDRFENIVDAVDLKGSQCIAVIGRRKDDRTGYIDLLENLECLDVGKMDIHKKDVGQRIAAYPLDRIHHRIDHRQNLNRRIYFPQKGFQIGRRGRFILNN